MTQPSEPSTVPGLPEPIGHAVNRFVPLVKTAVLVISVAAAIPTARNLYYSWMHGIPFHQVSHRLDQYDLWMKNLECHIEYRAISAANSSRIDVGACAKTGDIAIKVSDPNGQAAYEWIAFDRLEKPANKTAGSFGFFINSAVAQDSAKPTFDRKPGSFRLAQAGMEVMCQKKLGDKIVRVIKDGGKCFHETLSPLKGSIENRREVPCNTQC